MRRSLSPLIVLVLLTAPLAAFAADSVGVIGILQGSASATNASGAVRTLKAGDPVYVDEEISTAPESKLQLMLNDKSSVMVSANSKLAVREFAYNPSTKDGKLALSTKCIMVG